MDRLFELGKKKTQTNGVVRDIPDDALIRFTLATYPQYVAEPVHYLISRALMRVVRGEVQKLMIFAPPQHGKSELVSVRLPAFWLGERPNDPVLLSSYGASLAEDKGRQARDLVATQEYHNIYPHINLNLGSRAVQYWRLGGRWRGSMLSVGVGGPITGRGGLLGIIDDPFENWEQANSPTAREKVWNWYRSTFRTRIWEGGSIVIINTRWHEDDLCGRLLQTQADEWEVLRLPAVAETAEEREESNRFLGLHDEVDPLGRKPGEPLSPKRFSKNALKDLKKDVGTMAWNAEYQGCPRAPEGNLFKRAWYGIVGSAPYQGMRRVRYWDKAATEGGGAYTTGLLMAHDPQSGLIYIEDVVRGQWSTYEREQTILQTAQLDAIKYGSKSAVKIFIEKEPGSGGKDSAAFTIKNLAGYPVKADPPSGDKLTRAEPFATYSEAQMVKLVRGLWNQSWLDEISTVPNNTYFDQLDATSGAFNKLVSRDRGAKKGSVSRKRAGT